jgi:capsular polysaccharide biosynthesis protein
MNDRPEVLDDETELIDLLRVIWKWKFLILAGTLVCALIAGVMSLNRPKVYRIDMVLQAPVAGIDSRGRKIYIDSPQNIKTLIETEAFNRKILDHLKNSNSTVPKSLKFKVVIPKNSGNLTISYRSTNVDLAITILEQLEKQLLRVYNEVAEKYINNYKPELVLRKNRIAQIESENKISVKHIEKVRNRINELLLEKEKIDVKIKSLMDEQRKYISDVNKQDNINLTLLHNNIVHQLTTMRMIYKNEISDLLMQAERENDQLKLRHDEMDMLLIKIRQLENEINNIQYIQVIKPPTGSRYPIKRKIRLNILLAAVLGLFLMLFLAFFLDYLSKHKIKQS